MHVLLEMLLKIIGLYRFGVFPLFIIHFIVNKLEVLLVFLFDGIETGLQLFILLVFKRPLLFGLLTLKLSLLEFLLEFNCMFPYLLASYPSSLCLL